MSTNRLTLNVQSEIGKLEAVMLHYPGPEVENMTPKNAQRALYNDILNLAIAQKEYAQLKGVLEKYSRVYEVSDLLEKVVEIPRHRAILLQKICSAEKVQDYFEYLMELSSHQLARVLIEGLPMQVKTLTDFLKEEYYALQPLYNFYFTRDTSVVIGNRSLLQDGQCCPHAGVVHHGCDLQQWTFFQYASLKYVRPVAQQRSRHH